ncbi:MAG: ABC-2 type transporter [Bacillota bacterium]|nr:MAG: ABC-2 type transporter [Bacillota bacterium]MBS3949261.1 ABC transporter permease [Peptococcaceae bacterium]
MTSILLNNLRRTFRSTVRIIILVIMPLLFMHLFIPKSYEVPFRVALIDQDGSVLGNGLRNKLARSFRLVDVKEEDLSSALVNGILDYALIVRQGFTDEFLNSGHVAVEGYGISGPNVAAAVKNLVNSYLSSAAPIAGAARGNMGSFHQGVESFTAGVVDVDYVRTSHNSRDRTVGVLGFLVQFMVYMSVMTTGLILEERSNKTQYRILSAPVNMRQYMTGHLLSAFVVALIQVFSVFLFLKYAMGVYFGGFFFSLLLLFIVFAIVCICMGLLIISICTTPRQAFVAVILLTTPLVMLGGAYWPRSIMPNTLIRISDLLPTTWVMIAADKLVEGGALMSIGGELAILVAFAAVFFAGGVMRKVDIAK